MIKGSQNVRYERSQFNQKDPCQAQSGDDRGTHSRGRAQEQCRRDLQTGGHRPDVVLSMEDEVQGRWHSEPPGDEEGSEGEGPRKNQTRTRSSSTYDGSLRVIDRASAAQKKRELGLSGDLRGRHLPAKIRTEILGWIQEASAAGETLERACGWLQLNPRAVYRWKSGATAKENHGGGGGKNQITPLEQKRVLTMAKKFPQFRCRRIAYELERKSLVFIGKTKVAEILRKHGLNHAFVRGEKKPAVIPADMLLHEPWMKNLLWGTDWTYLRIAERFWFLLIVLDWYSRKIVSWGLFPEITKFQVVAVITNAVALEGIDLLPKTALKPRVVADHGSANVAAYTKSNIEIQGLDLWLSGIGRPTGNARTERVMGTLKREEINLQDQYGSETEARTRIGAAIWDYNFRRPNSGNGGFAPNSVHHQGRKALTERRKEARQQTENRRRTHWDQVSHAD